MSKLNGSELVQFGVHNIVKQHAFVRVGPKSITMERPNLVEVRT